MKKLALFNLENVDHLMQPADFAQATLQSPATSVFTDFKHSEPTIIAGDTTAADALLMMQQERSPLKLVVDDRNELTGLIHIEQLSEQAIMRQVILGADRRELKIRDLMRPRDRIKALAYQQLQNCTIADIINTLQSSGEQYCVVVDRDQHHIRGLIHAQDLARRLKMPVAIRQQPTFLSIFDSLYA
ncbi:CBS domain-containing protein [Rheinheimera sp. UJ51]|uniref:CBS domain-containing protein n=1 Tax=unclassified Rheinheimera TaxID=115860 RepID=UPI001E4D8F17|nr:MULTISPECIES: CBS domain-containing protein [unclassified Rheinheimera]MCC5452134.1 CBS domain-containing protein [Rheinheimera sp. UJ51]MCF4010691.1 CBS domain-containing protein [Rheinheimera sp. UJ63]